MSQDELWDEHNWLKKTAQYLPDVSKLLPEHTYLFLPPEPVMVKEAKEEIYAPGYQAADSPEDSCETCLNSDSVGWCHRFGFKTKNMNTCLDWEDE